MAQFAIEDLNISTAAVLTRQGDLYTEGISEFFALNFSELGGEIVASEFYEGDPSDFTGTTDKNCSSETRCAFHIRFYPRYCTDNATGTSSIITKCSW